MAYVVSGLVFALLVPALAHAATLENPGNGSFYSGIGVVSGLEVLNQRAASPSASTAVMPSPWPTAMSGATPAAPAGMRITALWPIWNYGNLGDGTHTAVVYDNGREFCPQHLHRDNPGGGFRQGRPAESVPSRISRSRARPPTFEWNQNTQNLLATEWTVGGTAGVRTSARGMIHTFVAMNRQKNQ